MDGHRVLKTAESTRSKAPQKYPPGTIHLTLVLWMMFLLFPKSQWQLFTFAFQEIGAS